MTAADIASCREAAEHCRRLAAKEVNPVEKHELQRIADEWLILAQTSSRPCCQISSVSASGWLR